MHRKPYSHHSPEFKEQALLKARHRGTRSLLSLAGELNMSPGTLKRWVLDSGKAAEQARGESSLALDGPAAAWSPAQRLTALRELKRKEKALAEVAALLVLQKNFQALLEGADK